MSIWQGSINRNELMADGMFKLDVAGKERNAAIGIAAAGTVFQVALDGTADCR